MALVQRRHFLGAVRRFSDLVHAHLIHNFTDVIDRRIELVDHLLDILPIHGGNEGLLQPLHRLHNQRISLISKASIFSNAVSFDTSPLMPGSNFKPPHGRVPHVGPTAKKLFFLGL